MRPIAAFCVDCAILVCVFCLALAGSIKVLDYLFRSGQ